jgi:fido (protein-threonine AMPylation protein)
MPESSDPYTYPGTDVLRNILDIRDPQSLAAFEANATIARLAELDTTPLKGRAQREFIRELGIEAGFLIDWSRTSRQQLMAASRESFSTGDCSGLADLIRGVIS